MGKIEKQFSKSTVPTATSKQQSCGRSDHPQVEYEQRESGLSECVVLLILIKLLQPPFSQILAHHRGRGIELSTKSSSRLALLHRSCRCACRDRCHFAKDFLATSDWSRLSLLPTTPLMARRAASVNLEVPPRISCTTGQQRSHCPRRPLPRLRGICVHELTWRKMGVKQSDLMAKPFAEQAWKCTSSGGREFHCDRLLCFPILICSLTFLCVMSSGSVTSASSPSTLHGREDNIASRAIRVNNGSVEVTRSALFELR